MVTIEKLTAQKASEHIDEFIALLQDSVDSGASIGFVPPLALDVGRSYWQDVFDDVTHGTRILLVATQDGVVVGSVQLEFSWKPSASHRAEVQKLIVHNSARQQGIGRQLMAAIEDEAKRAGRSLLVLDTVPGYPAERLYRQIGYVEVGTIPHFARNGEGGLDPTTFFYKLLE